MAKSTTTPSVQGTEVEFTIAKAIERRNLIYVTNKDGKTICISKEILLDNGLINCSSLNGKTIEVIDSGRTYTDNNIPFCYVEQHNIQASAEFTSLVTQQMAKLNTNRRFGSLLSSVKAKAETEE